MHHRLFGSLRSGALGKGSLRNQVERRGSSPSSGDPLRNHYPRTPVPEPIPWAWRQSIEQKPGLPGQRAWPIAWLVCTAEGSPARHDTLSQPPTALDRARCNVYSYCRMPLPGVRCALSARLGLHPALEGIAILVLCWRGRLTAPCQKSASDAISNKETMPLLVTSSGTQSRDHMN